MDDWIGSDMPSPAATEDQEIESQVKYGRTQKRSRKIEEINDAAAQVFIRDGYAEFSARKVAKEMGISLSTLQHYCGNTENLCLQMIKAKLESFVFRFQEIYTDSHTPPMEKLALAIRENVAATLDHYTGRLFFQMGALATQDERIKEVMIEQYEYFLTGLRYLVREINPQLNPDAVDTYSGLIATMIEGNFFYQWQPSLTPEIRAQMLDTSIALWSNTLMNPPRPMLLTDEV
jgi:AcrR family transcriptional regulator